MANTNLKLQQAASVQLKINATSFDGGDTGLTPQSGTNMIPQQEWLVGFCFWVLCGVVYSFWKNHRRFKNYENALLGRQAG